MSIRKSTAKFPRPDNQSIIIIILIIIIVIIFVRKRARKMEGKIPTEEEAENRHKSTQIDTNRQGNGIIRQIRKKERKKRKDREKSKIKKEGGNMFEKKSSGISG